MTTMTVEAIEKFKESTESSDSGAYRSVYFFGDDLVIKDDGSGPNCDPGWSANHREFQNSKKFKPGTFTDKDGMTINVAFPRTEMVGGYLISERVKFPSGRSAFPCNCNYYDRRSQYWYQRDEAYRRGGIDEADKVAPVEHYVSCPTATLLRIRKVIEKAYGLGDCHGDNWMWDKDTNTAWVIDFAD